MSDNIELKLELLKMIEELPEKERDQTKACIKEIKEIIKDNGLAGIYAMSLIAVENRG